MKQLILFIVVALATTISLHAAEVNFRTLTWDEAKAAATKEHKYIFVDGFTDWCYWCKVLDQKTFPDNAVVEFMNNNFVCLKLDMERDFGRLFAMKYCVYGFPSELIFTSEGKNVYRMEGYMPPAEFLKSLAKSVDKQEQTVYAGISNSFDLDYPEFYKAAFNVNGKKKFPDSTEVAAYLDKQTDLSTEVNWAVLNYCTLDAKHAQYVLENGSKLAALYGNSEVNQKISAIFSRQLRNAAATDSTILPQLLSDIDKYALADKIESKQYFKCAYYKKAGDWKRYARACEEVFKKDNFSNADQINECSWTIYQGCSDKSVLARAAMWMKKAVEISQTYAILDTYAAVLHKAGKDADAEKYARLAIETGKKEKTKTESTEKLLDEILGKTKAAE